MAIGRVGPWLYMLVLVLVFLKTEGLYAGLNIVHSAVAKGAVCLDGSPPAYHFDKGSGTGVNNWVVHVTGGGWCNNITTCLARKTTRLGSSAKMEKLLAFSGILSNQQNFNPDFYNWNRVKIGYCDGSSFTGDVQAVNPATKLYFRGARIFPAVIQELLAKGMSKAENAILSGCSAGGLTTILHCDSFKALLPIGTKVKCLSDAGYFVDVKDLSGAPHIQAYFGDIVKLHGSAKSLPPSCTSRMKPDLCFFPENVVQQIRTPLFLLNSAYDSWQIRNILAPVGSDPKGLWNDCKLDIAKCSTNQINTVQVFREQFLRALTKSGQSPSRGMYINSCFAHCQTELQRTWLLKGSPLLAGKAISNAVGDWFFDRVPFQKIDCPYPCNKSCLKGGADPRNNK